MEKLAAGNIDMNDVINYINNKDEYEKHLKGYIFDSLVYRYQLARYSQDPGSGYYCNIEVEKND